MDVRSFVPFLIFGCGSVLLFRLRGFFLLHPVRSAKKLARAFRQGGRMSRRTLILALAGTLGVGNITGVAAGLSVGGAGALLSRCIKKAEIIAYEDLGAEALRRLEVEDLPAFVIIDSEGNNLYETGRKEYLESIR